MDLRSTALALTNAGEFRSDGKILKTIEAVEERLATAVLEAIEEGIKTKDLAMLTEAVEAADAVSDQKQKQKLKKQKQKAENQMLKLKTDEATTALANAMASEPLDRPALEQAIKIANDVGSKSEPTGLAKAKAKVEELKLGEAVGALEAAMSRPTPDVDELGEALQRVQRLEKEGPLVAEAEVSGLTLFS